MLYYGSLICITGEKYHITFMALNLHININEESLFPSIQRKPIFTLMLLT